MRSFLSAAAACRLGAVLLLGAVAVGAGPVPREKVPAEKEAARPDDPDLWWSLRPLARPPVPATADPEKWVRTPVDAFVLANLREKGLRPSPEADRRTLIRRVSVDLTGLPPTPEEVDAFLKDKSPNAYETLVDRLLASPRYGERWARHWLDVAHYADSHGQDQDRPRPNAWPYRDYLIRAFNADKPYPRFVQEQIAGDALFPGDPDAIVATGFLAAGPWDESSLRDIQEDAIDRAIARYLDRDDVVTSVMSTFVGMTVHCARCHDHKFDPISQEDYYALQAVFAGMDKADRPYDPDAKVARRRAELRQEWEKVRSWKGKAEPALLTKEAQDAAAALEKEHASREGKWAVAAPSEVRATGGSTLKALPDQSVLSQGTRPDRDLYIVTLATEAKTLTGLRLEVLCDESLPHKGPGRQDNGNLHLSEIRVKVAPRDKPGEATPVALKNAVADFNQQDWGIARAIDGDPKTAWGIHPAVGQPHQAVFEFAKPVTFAGGAILTVEMDQLHGGGHLIGRFRLALTGAPAPFGDVVKPLAADLAALLAVPAASRTDAQKAELARLALERKLEHEWATLPLPQKVYCGSNQFDPDGNFKPVAKPRPVQVLKRGDIAKPLKDAVPGALECVPGLTARFRLDDPDQEGQRRAALARWVTDPKNPLVWRSIVNRVWHYHFGRGIVDTPNDLGKMGGKPSHPELLDWLAAEFRDGGGSLKKLHRLIVTTSAYRQQCRHDERAAAIDGDNRLLWRMNRGRLDAESVRDAVLLASGRLDLTMYGAPGMHFIMKPGIHVTPVADYDAFDVDRPEARRRSVYRYIFRTRPDPFLGALDCPDASQAAPVRGSSVGAPQALALWNDKFMTRNSEHLAALAGQAAPDLPGQVAFAFERVLCRPPTDAEKRDATEYARKHGLANLCRVLFNASEFLFVD